MTESDNAMSSAMALLAERRKFEAWLAALNARRGATPEHVFTRVKADYEQRLQGVVDELASRADALDERVHELTGRAGELDGEAQRISDERAEAELRAHVGELDPDAWTDAAATADRKLQDLAEEQRTVNEELESIRELLEAARKPTPMAGMAAVEPESGSAQEPGHEPAPEEQPESGQREPEFALPGEAQPDAAPIAAANAEPSEDTGAGGDAPITSTEPVAEQPERKTGGFDELAFLRDVTGVTPGKPLGLDIPVPSQRPSGERPLDDSLGLVLPDETPAYTPPRRPSTETPMAANVTGNSPIVIKGDQKQGKTLKCTDCGAMNLPTEWYCERCGAELAAL